MEQTTSRKKESTVLKKQENKSEFSGDGFSYKSASDVQFSFESHQIEREYCVRQVPGSFYMPQGVNAQSSERRGMGCVEMHKRSDLLASGDFDRFLNPETSTNAEGQLKTERVQPGDENRSCTANDHGLSETVNVVDIIFETKTDHNQIGDDGHDRSSVKMKSYPAKESSNAETQRFSPIEGNSHSIIEPIFYNQSLSHDERLGYERLDKTAENRDKKSSKMENKNKISPWPVDLGSSDGVEAASQSVNDLVRYFEKLSQSEESDHVKKKEKTKKLSSRTHRKKIFTEQSREIAPEIDNPRNTKIYFKTIKIPILAPPAQGHRKRPCQKTCKNIFKSTRIRVVRIHKKNSIKRVAPGVRSGVVAVQPLGSQNGDCSKEMNPQKYEENKHAVSSTAGDSAKECAKIGSSSERRNSNDPFPQKSKTSYRTLKDESNNPIKSQKSDQAGRNRTKCVGSYFYDRFAHFLLFVLTILGLIYQFLLK